ncbi:MAG: hypothetical protein NPIRA05_02750 [Nitrospirales bacterium]|nr:MAG: hypothetical protein NPIRA05_02750 [Nitrospirales bacterium]
MSPTNTSEITISIISHTNIGKTTLVRTLLRRDVGKVLDQAHVTDQNEKFTWVETGDGARLHIWDTPGFGNSVQLLKLLQQQEHPIGWMVAHVWDRFKDRPLWCSQQALKNVRDEADVVLYLVNALENPRLASGYIKPEMELLDWLQKPVLVILNQIGSDGGTLERDQCERDWHDSLKPYSVVQGILSLDSFSRCWMLEGVLLEHVQRLLPAVSQETMIRLIDRWNTQNIEVFKKAMNRVAHVLIRAASDEENVNETGQLREMKVKHAAQELRHRLENDIRLAMQDLIEWHGLEGEAAIKIQSQLQDVTVPIESSAIEDALGRAALGGFGGAAAGTAAGAAIDAATGGMSLGLFALTGAFLGALGLAAWGKEVEMEETLKIKWVPEFLHTLTQDLLLRYMAVAHFGRGRGNFQADQGNPTIWLEELQKVYGRHQHKFQQVWSTDDQEREGPNLETLQKQLSLSLESLTREVLLAIYPAAEKYLEQIRRN